MNFRTIPPVGYRISVKNALKAFINRNTVDKHHTNNTVTIAFDSGSSALLFLLKLLKVKNPCKTQVVVPVYTCYSIAAVIEYAGLEVVLCDLDPDTLDFNYSDLEQCLNKNTLCIISTHFFGRRINNIKLAEIKNKNAITIIEDAAQGGYSIKNLDEFSDFIITSTGRGKPISTMGGGYLLTRSTNQYADLLLTEYEGLKDESILSDLIVLAKIFIVNILLNPYLYTIPSVIPYFRLGETVYPELMPIKKLTRFQQKLLSYEKTSNIFDNRHKAAVYYHGFIKKSLCKQPHSSQFDIDNYQPVRFPVYMNSDIDKLPIALLKKLSRYGIVSMYPKLLSELEPIKLFCSSYEKSFPGGEYLARRLVTLPTHTLLGKKDIENIVLSISKVAS